MKILIDNGHGDPPLTGGKCSPDRSFKEYVWAREIARRISRSLSLKGFDTVLLVPEETDTPISTRVKKVNAWCDKVGKANCLLVSIHVNAGGKFEWSNARGWMCIIDDAASQGSKDFAANLHDEALAHGLTVRHYLPTQKWYLYGQALGTAGKRLGILRSTKCPAVLTENLFMTNKEDVAYLNSEEGKQAITDLHVQAIIKYCNEH